MSGYTKSHSRLRLAQSDPIRRARHPCAPSLKEKNNSGRHNKHEYRLWQSWKCLLLNTWFIEAIAMTFSVLCLAAIVLVMAVYDQKSRPIMPYGVTLNAIVSTLATASKSFLICAVAGAMSQLKWCWFTTKDHKLQDMQTLDDASRGPMGSLAMLFSFAWMRLVSIGALITVLAATFDPFVQQVLKYPIRQADDLSHVAIVQKASVFTVVPESNQFTSAINAGIWYAGGQPGGNPVCSSGNCHWPIFRSLAWCSKCSDVTSSANVILSTCDLDAFVDRKANESFHCDFTFDGGNSITLLHGVEHSRSPVNGPDPNHLNFTSQVVWALHNSPATSYAPIPLSNRTFLSMKSPFLALAYVSLDSTSLFSPNGTPDGTICIDHAEECVLTPCTREYNISIVNGIRKVSIVSENYGLTTVAELDAILGSETTLWYGPCWQADPGNVTYPVSRGQYAMWSNSTEFAFCGLDY